MVVGESTITAAPFFEGAGRPSKSFWGPQQGRRVILWESLRPEDQERCLTELRSDRSWVIWCKTKPKDMPVQSFREYGKCIFVGKCKKQRQADKSQAESAGGRHVTRARGWWKRGDVAACAACDTAQPTCTAGFIKTRSSTMTRQKHTCVKHGSMKAARTN